MKMFIVTIFLLAASVVNATDFNQVASVTQGSPEGIQCDYIWCYGTAPASFDNFGPAYVYRFNHWLPNPQLEIVATIQPEIIQAPNALAGIALADFRHQFGMYMRNPQRVAVAVKIYVIQVNGSISKIKQINLITKQITDYSAPMPDLPICEDPNTENTDNCTVSMPCEDIWAAPGFEYVPCTPDMGRGPMGNGLTFGHYGELYSTDAAQHRVYVKKRGQPMELFYTDKRLEGLVGPNGVIVDNNELLVALTVGTQGQSAIYKINIADPIDMVEFLNLGFTAGFDEMTEIIGGYMFTAALANKVIKTDKDGNVLEMIENDDFSWPAGIDFIKISRKVCLVNHNDETPYVMCARRIF